MGEPEEVDHAATGLGLGQCLGQGRPGGGVLAAGEEAVAVDRGGERLRLAAQGVDDVVVVDAVGPAPVLAGPQAGMAEHLGAAEPGLDAVVVDVDAQALADQPRGGAVEDAVHQEAAGAGDAGDQLGEVGGAAGWQALQGGRLDPECGLAAAVAPGDELVNEAAPVGETGEVARAAQDQGLIEGGLEVAVVGLDRAVLVRLAGVVAAGRHAVVGAEGLITAGGGPRPPPGGGGGGGRGGGGGGGAGGGPPPPRGGAAGA